jgi:hypothetical protein
VAEVLKSDQTQAYTGSSQRMQPEHAVNINCRPSGVMSGQAMHQKEFSNMIT